MTIRRGLTLLLVALALGPTAHASRLTLRLTAEDFVLGDAFERNIHTALQRMTTWFEDVLGASFGPELEVSIRLIADRARYDAGARETLGDGGSTLGYFSRATGGVMWRNPDTDQLRGTLVHETCHHLQSTARRTGPEWFDEGLAELFERFRVVGNAVRLGVDQEAYADLVALPDARRPTARFVMTADDAAWSAYDTDWPHHTYGGLFVHFLAESPRGERALRAAADAWAAHRREAAVADAVAAAFGGPAPLERAWSDWVRRGARDVELPIKPVTLAPAEEAPTAGCAGILMRRGDAEVCVPLEGG